MFYSRLKEICEEKNTNVTTLLKNLNLSSGNLSKWKNGGVPKSETISKIAEYLGVSVDYLLGYTPDKQQSNDSLKRLLAFAEKLTDEQIDTIIAMGTAFLDSKK